MQHNVLTMLQAWIFPLSVWFACSKERIAVATASIYLAASAIHPALFSFGYDLIPLSLKVAAGTVYTVNAILNLLSYWNQAKEQQQQQQQQQYQNNDNQELRQSLQDNPDESESVSLVTNKARLLRTAAVGMMGLTVLPLVSDYPMATIPSILGKRMSRSAAAFYGLAAAGAMSLSVQSEPTDRSTLATRQGRFTHLAKGLTIGSLLHVLLVLLKLAGVDDGGFLLPGEGLWKWYPAMLKVPVALTTSLLVHVLVATAGWLYSTNAKGTELE